jgi:hypothetical protein
VIGLVVGLSLTLHLRIDLWPQFGTPENKPVTCILIGMAGTGKTTFMQVGKKRFYLIFFFFRFQSATLFVAFSIC